MHKIKILILVLTFQSLFIFGNNSFVINSGYNRPVQSFSQQNNNILYSCDARGTLMIWDTESKSLIDKIQISYLQVKTIAVNSSGTKLAVVETDNISSFRLSVWDLQKKIKLFSHKMEGLPIFIKFSPNSNFIVYSKTDWNGLVFLDSSRGQEVPLLFEDYGIVSSIYLTSSEKTLMFYSPSGNIQYWNLTNGTLKAPPIKTRRELSSINMTRDGTLMTASDGDSLYLISLRTGGILYSEKLSNIQYAGIDNSTNKLIVLFKKDNNLKLGVWSIYRANNQNSLIKEKEIDINPNINTSAGFEIINNKIYFSGVMGEILVTDINTGSTMVFSKNIISSISDLSILNGELFLATDKELITLKSDFFQTKLKITKKTDIKLDIIKNPFNVPTGIVNDGKSFFVYPMDILKGSIKKLYYNNLSIVSDDFSSPLVSVDYSNGKFISLEKDGTCRIINSSTGKNIFKYSSFGINSLAYVYGNNLIAGRNRTVYLKSPLLHINPASEEVVPIKESNLLIFKVDYDSITRTLYTLGFEERTSGLKTVLKSHTGRNWELSETIMTYPGEDQSGTFVVDERKSRIYLSIGNSGLIMYGWEGFTNLENTNHVPEKLYIYGDYLISLNIDFSITIWDTDTGKIILNYFLLKNNKWIAVNADENIILSDSSLQEYIN